MVKKAFVALVLVFSVILCLSSCQKKVTTALSPENPVSITIWNYYNGNQLTAFNKLVDEFNGSVGKEKGIKVTSISQGNINTLADNLLLSVDKVPGAAEIPTLAAVYAETAFLLEQKDSLASMDDYFTKEELSEYVPGFIEEGRFNQKSQLMLFPILKSTELFSANETDWEPFEKATGISLNSIKTKEDLVDASKAYYEYTDALTPQKAEDGKALYGRDSLANYIFVGCYQLGHEMFPVKDGKMTAELDKDTFKTLWDNYYIPFINGYFGAYGKFRSDDCKTGKILALTSSSSSVSYLPTSVTISDGNPHDISTFISVDLPFEDAKNDAVVQQGASYCLLKGTEAETEGAVVFLKWFTEDERNMKFAEMSGYSPVKLASNTEKAISSSFSGDLSSAKGQNTLNGLKTSAKAISEHEAYASKPFAQSKEVRSLLEGALKNVCTDDRASVVAAIANGMTREEAVSAFTTDVYFDAWFENLSNQINALL